MNIDGFGKQLVDQLVDEGLLQTVADIFSLRYEQLIGLDRMADKSVKNLLAAIDASKQVGLARFFYALGIPFLGEQGAELLAERYQNLLALLGATAEELESIHGVGPKMALSICNTFALDAFQGVIDQCLELGVMVEAHVSQSQGGKFSGKTVLFTGTLQTMSRVEAEKLVKAEGGKVVKAVSKSLDVLVVGEEPDRN